MPDLQELPRARAIWKRPAIYLPSSTAGVPPQSPGTGSSHPSRCLYGCRLRPWVGPGVRRFLSFAVSRTSRNPPRQGRGLRECMEGREKEE